MPRTGAGAASAVAMVGLVVLLGACAPAEEPTPAPPAETSRPLGAERPATGTDGVGGLGFDVVALDPDGDGLVVHRLGDR